MKIIKHNDTRLALHYTEDDIKDGLGFFSEDSEFIQVGTWRYDAGKKLQNHNHFIVERDVNRTQEAIVVLRGSLLARVYDEDDNLIDEVTVSAHEGMIMLAGGHGYDILEDDTIVIETKNGPYPGAEVDRRRF